MAKQKHTTRPRAKLNRQEKMLIARNVEALGWRETARRIEGLARQR